MSDNMETNCWEDAYVEPRASSKEWLKQNVMPTRSGTAAYAKSLFPIFTWIYRYNWTWFLGDLIAGATVGAVVIPQGMAYAKLVQLPPEFGLYSSFVGSAMYFMFATSKDNTVGPGAVMSTLLGHVLQDLLVKLPEFKDQPWIVAGCMSLVLGCIAAAIGLLRLGFIVDFIPLPAIAAFITGSALNIAMGQIPALMGNNSVKAYDTRASTYLVFGNFFKYISHCDMNAAVGLTALFLLYAIRSACKFGTHRWPRYEKVFFFASTLRTVFVILLYTLISYLVNRNHRDNPKFSILGTVPRGFKHMNVPTVNSHILSAVASKLPSVIMVMVIEHISISKSFGRINNYTINPNQELIAIGITNIFGPFFGAYPINSAFSRTAINSKAGVRTPLAGLITASIIAIAIYGLPPVFFYISNALLAAVIIHAVGDLISKPTTIRSFWRISPFEFVIFWAGVIVSVFSSMDNGIYTTVAASAALLLFRIARARGDFIGTVQVHSQLSESTNASTDLKAIYNCSTEGSRRVYMSLDGTAEGTNPSVKPETPPAGIYIYRLNEGYLYPNAVHFTDHMVAEIKAQTRPGILNPYGSLGNRPWNDPGPRQKSESDIDTSLPLLRAVILDFTGVSNVDITSIQNLIDVRKQLDCYSDNDVVWHFSGVGSPWVRRALVAGGFGSSDPAMHTVFSVANVAVIQDRENDIQHRQQQMVHGRGHETVDHGPAIEPSVARLLSAEHPLFHIDLDEALAAAKLELGL
ncbi:hypothetical protein LPJ59_002007 [Coemansia sp. RSA 2399]|nr:hypothetical protein LPJ59_002007 [Coemansia sp. RSA 2399]